MKSWLTYIFIFIPFLTTFSTELNSYHDNLYYTCRVWGFLKYYHSEVAKGEINWDKELFETLDSLKTASTKEEFNNIILELIESAGEMEEPTTDPPAELPGDLSFNLDFDWFEDDALSDTVKSELVKIRDWFRPHDNFYVTQNYLIPYFDNDNQFLSLSPFINPEENIRLLALFRHWNIIKYFYPYNQIIDQDWDSTLVQFIPKFLEINDVVEYNKTIMELQTYLNDTHCRASSKIITQNFEGQFYLPLELTSIDNNTVVQRVFTTNKEINRGDIIKSINNIDIESIRDSLGIIKAASNKPQKDYLINRLLIRSNNNNAVKITIQNPDSLKEVTLNKMTVYDYALSARKTKHARWEIIDSNNSRYGYVDMGKLKVDDIEKMFDYVWDTDAIIFDIRDYPNATLWYMINYLFDEPIQNADFTIPDVSFPGTFNWYEEVIGEGDFSKTYDKPIIILFNEETLSQAEYTAMSFEQHPKSIKIGSQTAGADGDVTLVRLPAGVTVYYTSLGVYYPDKTPTQRIGIVPDIEVHPTIQGIREGRDEVLEVALQQVVTSVKDDSKISSFKLSQNFPNPFNPSTIIQYDLAENSFVKLKVYDILGNEITTLVDKEVSAGNHEIKFDGSELSSGIYFYKLTTKNFIRTKKMVLIK